jgi:hypothetical protein
LPPTPNIRAAVALLGLTVLAIVAVVLLVVR